MRTHFGSWSECIGPATRATLAYDHLPSLCGVDRSAVSSVGEESRDALKRDSEQIYDLLLGQTISLERLGLDPMKQAAPGLQCLDVRRHEFDYERSFFFRHHIADRCARLDLIPQPGRPAADLGSPGDVLGCGGFKRLEC